MLKKRDTQKKTATDRCRRARYNPRASKTLLVGPSRRPTRLALCPRAPRRRPSHRGNSCGFGESRLLQFIGTQKGEEEFTHYRTGKWHPLLAALKGLSHTTSQPLLPLSTGDTRGSLSNGTPYLILGYSTVSWSRAWPCSDRPCRLAYRLVWQTSAVTPGRQQVRPFQFCW